MVRSFAASLAALACLTAGAEAQDYFQPGPGPGFAGAEVGAQIGAAVGGAGDVGTNGVGAGGYAGYNLQNGPIVGGVEADTMPGSYSGTGHGGRLSQNWMTSARVRGGYAFGRVLAYGTVGPAWATSSFQSGGYSAGKSLQGYALGVGGEVGVTRNVSARAELRHYEFGSPTYYMPSGAQKISNGDNFLMVGLGARF